MVAWTPGLFSLFTEGNFLPRFKDLFLSPLTLAGPSVCTLAVCLWLLDFGFGRPETWKETDHVHEETENKGEEVGASFWFKTWRPNM